MASFSRPASLILLLPALACGGEVGGSSNGAPEVVREMDGDTSVIRTVAGSVWGAEAELVPEVEIGVLDGDERFMFGSIRSIAVTDAGRIYVMDSQIPSLRVYNPDGSHVGDWGRDGNGPGEFGQPDGGLVVLSDGRVAVRDPGNARLQIFSPEGEPVDDWPVIAGGFNTSNPMHVTPGDTILTPAVINLGVSDIADWKTGFVRIHEGEIIDSVEVPDVGYEGPMIRASREGSTSINNVPFSPSEDWAWHPDGYFLHGISDRYAVHLLKPTGPVRLARTAESAPVSDGEASYRRESATRNMRNTDPNWRWDGPGIPDRKPAFRDLRAGEDGRIWVMRHSEGVRRDNPDWDPQDPENEAPQYTWFEPVSWDVFEADGTFLGTVHAPEDFSIYPTPVYRGEYVWASTRDELGVQRLVRFRIQPRSTEND